MSQNKNFLLLSLSTLLEYVFSYATKCKISCFDYDGYVTAYRGIGSISQPPEKAISWTGNHINGKSKCLNLAGKCYTGTFAGVFAKYEKAVRSELKVKSFIMCKEKQRGKY